MISLFTINIKININLFYKTKPPLSLLQWLILHLIIIFLKICLKKKSKIAIFVGNDLSKKERQIEIQNDVLSGDLSIIPFNMLPCDYHVTFMDRKVDERTSMRHFKAISSLFSHYQHQNAVSVTSNSNSSPTYYTIFNTK